MHLCLASELMCMSVSHPRFASEVSRPLDQYASMSRIGVSGLRLVEPICISVSETRIHVSR